MSDRRQDSNAISIALVTGEAAIKKTFAVMVQLRPGLEKKEYVQRVQRQQIGGYLLANLMRVDTVKAVVGFRLIENFSRGKHVYVDDLVTEQAERSKGYGAMLFKWVIAYAQDEGCNWLELDSGVHRQGAHRFYFDHRMHISTFRFSLELD